MISKKWTLSKEDLIKIGTGLMIASLGGIATYLEQDILKILDFGEWTGLATVINSMLVNTIRKFITENTYE